MPFRLLYLERLECPLLSIEPLPATSVSAGLRADLTEPQLLGGSPTFLGP